MHLKLPQLLSKVLPVLALSFVALTSVSTSAQTSESYWQGVQKAGVLRCGAAVAPPYVIRNPATGEYSGFFADMCKDFAAVLKVKPQFVDTTWDNIVAGLQSGKWDMAMGLNRTPLRAMAINFSVAVVQTEITFVYNKTNKKIPASLKSVADIDKPGVTLAVMSGSAQEKALTGAVTKATILRLPTNDETRLALTAKRADMVVDADDSNLLLVQSNPDWAVAFNPKPALTKQGVAFGLPKQLSYSDIEAVNIFVEEKIATGAVDGYIKKAVGELMKASK